MADRQSVAPLGSSLTERERQVVAAYRLYRSYVEAARALGISPRTVREHLSNARSRRGARWTWELFTETDA